MNELRCVLPFHLVPSANAREHWSITARRTREQRGVTRMRLGMIPGRLPCVVTLTRIGPKALDGDNLRNACKAVRDGVADALGVKSDADPRITWQYAQIPTAKCASMNLLFVPYKGGRKGGSSYGVQIRIGPREGPP